jgi:hypothetical protein
MEQQVCAKQETSTMNCFPSVVGKPKHQPQIFGRANIEVFIGDAAAGM